MPLALPRIALRRHYRTMTDLLQNAREEPSYYHYRLLIHFFLLRSLLTACQPPCLQAGLRCFVANGVLRGYKPAEMHPWSHIQQ